MKTSKLIVLFVLFDFAALNVFAFTSGGWSALREVIAAANPWVLLVGADLIIALGMVSVWLYTDARARGRSPLLYLVLTWTTGSIGPLLYLLRRDSMSRHPGQSC